MVVRSSASTAFVRKYPFLTSVSKILCGRHHPKGVFPSFPPSNSHRAAPSVVMMDRKTLEFFLSDPRCSPRISGSFSRLRLCLNFSLFLGPDFYIVLLLTSKAPAESHLTGNTSGA